MSSYYDPWAHAVQIFLTRILQFTSLTFAVGLSIFACLLRYYFDQSWMAVGRTIWNWQQLNSDGWRLIIGLSICNGFLMSVLMFAFIYRSSRNDDERHHRGARLVKGWED